MNTTARTLHTHTNRALLAAALLVAGTLLAVPANGSAVPGAPRDGWARYEVPMVAVAGTSGPCCHDLRNGTVVRRGCDLDRRGGITIEGDDRARTDASAADALAVYLHFKAGRIDRMQAYAATCPVRADATPVALAVTPADSLVLLDGLARSGTGNADEAVMALAHHAGDDATARLVELSAAGNPRELRKDAVFWLTQVRGVPGAQAVERIARADADPKLREHAVFALSQSDAVDSFAIIEDVARTDASADVRAQSLFWMAQTGDARAADAIVAALRRDDSRHVREQAVFALSQLDDGGDAALIEVVRGDYPREAKKTALFWLGQSGSAEAIAFLDSVLSS